MWNQNSELAGLRKAMRVVAALAILAWIVQAIWAGDARGEEPRRDETSRESKESFAPGTARFLQGATLEMRGAATISGGDVTLKQICRWADADKAAFEPIQDLVVVRLGNETRSRALSLRELKTLLHDAGVNLAVIRFTGQTQCSITRTDLLAGPRPSLDEFLRARQAAALQTVEAATRPATTQPLAAMVVAQLGKEPRNLRQLLVTDLAERLSLDPATLQVNFNPTDDRVLVLAEPLVKFSIDGRRVRGLGSISWDVTLQAGDAVQKVTIDANARAWVTQLEVVKPVSQHQVIRAEDLLEKRALVEQLPQSSLKKDQVIGQMASQGLTVGTLVTPRHVEAVPLVKVGQFVTVNAEYGTVRVQTSAIATETGTFGQTIRLRNTATGDTFDATVIGPQAARVGAANDQKPHVATVSE